jgi:hypothetical protein
MFDPSSEIQQAYFNRLSLDIPVFDAVDETHKGDYVYFSNINVMTGGGESKCRRGFVVIVTLNIVTRFKGNQGGFYQASLYASQITSQIATVGNYIDTDNFQIVTTTLDGSGNTSMKTETGMLYMRSVSFRHEIVQKPQES